MARPAAGGRYDGLYNYILSEAKAQAQFNKEEEVSEKHRRHRREKGNFCLSFLFTSERKNDKL
jgi:hypothetical protein